MEARARTARPTHHGIDKMKSPTWPVILVAAALVIAFVVYTVISRIGALEPVVISQESAGPFHVLTKDHLGAYHKIGPVISEVEAWARANGEPCSQSFGEYFDDPEKNDEDRLKSRGGCLLSKSFEGANSDWASRLPKGMTLATIESRNVVKAVFNGAPSLGPVKVYPKVFEFMNLNDLKIAGAILEIYSFDSKSGKGSTAYLFPSESVRK